MHICIIFIIIDSKCEDSESSLEKDVEDESSTETEEEIPKVRIIYFDLF